MPAPGHDERLGGARALLFDLDGTLVDTMQAFADLAADVMSRRHGAAHDWCRARYLATSGAPFVEQLEVIFPGHPRNPEASDEFEKSKRAVCDRTPMDDATVAALVALRGLGYRLVVSSNTGQDVVDEFSRRERFRFDLALGFEPARGLAKGRPHVEAVERALAVERHHIIFVGDSLRDSELAAECRVPFIARLGTFGAADFEARDPRIVTVAHVQELPALLGALQSAA